MVPIAAVPATALGRLEAELVSGCSRTPSVLELVWLGPRGFISAFTFLCLELWVGRALWVK